MRRILVGFLRLIYHLLRYGFDLIRGRPVIYAPLTSATLGKDDVHVARQWLRDRAKWTDHSFVEEYEKKFAEWNGSKYAFAFMGGRVALSACIYGLGLKDGDEVILPGYTCVVVPNAFRFAGINMVYSDIELDTYGLDASLIEDKITERTKAILLHHLYGLVCRDYEKILEIAAKYDIKVIEDCAHSTGALFRGKKVGNYGHVAFYSSEQSKIFTTHLGGMAITNDTVIAERIREYYSMAPFPGTTTIEKLLRDLIYNYYACRHPMRWFLADALLIVNENNPVISTTPEEINGKKPASYGSRMPAPVAALGINQLNKIDYYNQKRRDAAKVWDSWCKNSGYKQPKVLENSVPVYLRYPVMVDVPKKENLSWAVEELHVHLGVWFTGKIHPVDLPMVGCVNADRAVQHCVNLPTSSIT